MQLIELQGKKLKRGREYKLKWLKKNVKKRKSA